MYPLFILFFSLLMGCLLYYYGLYFDSKSLIIPLLVLFGILPLGNLIIHIQYYLKNRNTELRIDYSAKVIYVDQDQYRFDQILSIEVHRNFRGFRRVGFRLPSDEYFYYCVKLNNGDKLFLTSLLVESIESTCFSDRLFEVQRIIPFIKR